MVNDTENIEEVQQCTLPWIKLWCKMIDNAKVQMLNEADQRRLICLWILKAQNQIPHNLSDEQIAFKLRIKSEELERTKKVLVENGFITEDWDIERWEEYQARSTSRDRVRKFRAKTNNKVLERDENTCVYCGAEENVCVSTLIPQHLTDGNTKLYNSTENMVVACRSCVRKKSKSLPEDAGLAFLSLEAEEMYYAIKKRLLTKAPKKKKKTNGLYSTTKVTSVTVTSNDYSPSKGLIAEWQSTYPLVNVPERVDYVLKYLKTKAVGLTNNTQEGVKAYLVKSLQETQKKAEEKIDSKVMHELTKKYKEVEQTALHERLLQDTVYESLPLHHAQYIAKLRGLEGFYITSRVLVFQDIIQRAKTQKEFNLSAAKQLAKELLPEEKLPERVKRYIANLDARKETGGWDKRKYVGC